LLVAICLISAANSEDVKKSGKSDMDNSLFNLLILSKFSISSALSYSLNLSK